MSNGIELKAIIDSRIQQLKQDIVDTKTPSQSSSKLVLRQKKNVEDSSKVQEPTFDLESSWVALSRKSKLYNDLSQDSEFLESEDILVDFTKKEITIKDSTQDSIQDPWVEIVDEFGRNRLVRSSTLNQPREKSTNLDIHYDPNKEIRNLGTSHYKFSKEESKRQLELQELNNLRKETAKGQQDFSNTRLQKTKSLQERRLRIQELKKSKVNK